MVSSVNSHANATRIGWHLWEIDLRFAPGQGSAASAKISISVFPKEMRENPILPTDVLSFQLTPYPAN